MPRILVSDSLSQAGLSVLGGQPGFEVTYAPGLKEPELAQRIAGFDALVIRSGSRVTQRVIESAADLRVIGRAGIGVDNVDVEAASRRGILVMNTPTGNAVTTAEHAIALLLAIARKVPQATASMRAGQWEKSKFSGRELAGKTLGILGLGNIGRIVADRAKGLHMHVIAYDPVLTPERATKLGVELVSLGEFWERADAITAHTPLTAETQGIVNDDAIARMRKGVLLVNCARGGIYDEGALQRGLASGKIGGVALDVFVEEPPGRHPLLELDNVIATPHLGASTEEAQERVSIEICEQIVAYLQNGTIANAVNAPNVSREAAPKLAPYLDLARKLGAFLAQVERIHPRAIEVDCAGEPAELGLKAITSTVVAGLMGPFLSAPVNPVSAPPLAAERGIRIRETRSERGTRLAHSVTVKAEGQDGDATLAEGTVGSDGRALLTRWREYEISADLRGHALVLFNENRPGVVGAVGSILGRREVNISAVHLGLRPSSSQAVSVWTVDSPIPPAVLQEILQAPHVSRAVAIDLG